LLLVGAFRYLNRGRDFAAGFLIGVGLFKFQLIVPVAVLFFLWRRWRFLGGFSLAATAAAAISVSLTGVSQSLAYVHLLQSMSIRAASAADRLKTSLEPNMMPNVRGLLFGLFNGYLPNFWLQLLTICLSCGLLLWIARSASRRTTTDLLFIAIVASTLASYHMIIQDMTILLLPIVVAMDRCIRAETAIASWERFKLRTAVLMFTAPLLMSWAPAHFYLAAVPLLVFMIAISLPTSVLSVVPGFRNLSSESALT